ncbi:MAG TPA: DUF2784 domain-containing protein [Planctomycetota bacterium]
MSSAALADLIVVLHLGYVLFVIVGLVLIWLGVALRWGWVRRPAFRVPHLVCTLIVPVEALIGYVCPLTTWEHALRRRAGQHPEEISFMGRLARDLLFYEAPQWVFTLCYVAFGLVVVATFLCVPMRRRATAG